ncbi:hypothetical protein BBJ28_00007436 [Nothophytophthora sp. Chile5]|nr:hypothetical protein BBJ28_00007436 [Nothophytophthora sp. Chile5]
MSRSSGDSDFSSRLAGLAAETAREQEGHVREAAALREEILALKRELKRTKEQLAALSPDALMACAHGVLDANGPELFRKMLETAQSETTISQRSSPAPARKRRPSVTSPRTRATTQKPSSDSSDASYTAEDEEDEEEEKMERARPKKRGGMTTRGQQQRSSMARRGAKSPRAK